MSESAPPMSESSHPPVAPSGNRIERLFADLRQRGAKALMPFVCGGHPSPDALRTLVPALERGGASIVEVGIPFSDPIADGPVIAAAMHQALGRGVTPASVMEDISAVRGQVGVGLVAMVTVSIVHRLGGPAGFARRAAQAGFDGCIFPDVPLEEAGPLVDAAREAGLVASLLVAPSTPPERAARIAQACSGFVYVLARSGITGEREDAPDVSQRVRQLRDVTDLPLAFGFGISRAEHVRAVVRHADAAIVGSALVRRLGEAEPARGAEVGEGFCRELSAGLFVGG